MPKTEIVGTGITQVKATTLSPIEPADKQRLVDSLNYWVARGDPLTAQLNDWATIATGILKDAGLPQQPGKMYRKDGTAWLEDPSGCSLAHIIKIEGIDQDSASGYSLRLLNLIHILQIRLEAGDSNGAASFGIDLGMLIREWQMKDRYERRALVGGKTIRGGKAGAAIKHDGTRSRHESWFSEFQRLRRQGKRPGEAYDAIAKANDMNRESIARVIRDFQKKL